jgi:tetratricopeptide (TPR) repeat protein
MQRPRAKLLNLIVLLFSIGVLTDAVPASLQKDTSRSSSSRVVLRSVLVQARDAAIEFARGDGDTNYEPDPITKKISELHEFLIFIGDHEDIEYLREHLKKKYADEIRDPVPVPDKRETFSKLVMGIELEESSTQHDGDLARIVSQEIECGFLDDALAHATLLRSSSFRCHTQGQVALAAHENGKADVARRAVEAAIQAASEEDSTGPLYPRSPSRNLDQLAASFLDHEYREGARMVLVRNQQLLPTLPSTSGFDWRFQAEQAIELGDLEMARKALEQVGPDAGHADVEDALRAAKGRNMPPVQALKNAKTIVDPTTRSRSFCEIAERQASSGDTRGAAATFQFALQAAEDIDQFKVLSLNDIAWSQIRSGDRKGAEQTLNLALQENEKPGLGSDQVDGWAITADTLAYLGQFERARTTVMRISDHFYRGRGLGFIASRSVQSGRTQEMIGWSSKLDDPEDRCEAFLRIAEAIIDEQKMK